MCASMGVFRGCERDGITNSEAQSESEKLLIPVGEVVHCHSAPIIKETKKEIQQLIIN